MNYAKTAAEITPRDLRKLLENKSANILLIDVREPWEHEIAKLENSILVPLSQLPAKIAKLDKELSMVVYCHHGIRSWQAAKVMAAAGFKNVANLQGGIDAWSKEADPNVPTY